MSDKAQLIKYITPETPEAEVLKNDCLEYSGIIASLKTAWQMASSVDEICKLALTHTKVLESRRNLLGMGNNEKDKSRYPGFGAYDG